MKISCEVNMYNESLPNGEMPKDGVMRLSMSRKYNGYVEVEINDKKFLVDFNELNKAIACVGYEYDYLCGC